MGRERPEKSTRGRRPDSARTRTREENERRQAIARARREADVKDRSSGKTRSARTEQARGSRRVSSEDAVEVESTSRARWYRRPRLMIPLVLVAVIALGVVAWFTPLMSVREIEVAGAESIAHEEVLTALKVPQGQPLLRVDTGGAAARVAQIPKVESARVQRMYPSTIRVTVTERTPVVFVDSPDGPHLLDKDAVDYEVGPPPPGVPRLVTQTPGFGDANTDAALDVLSSMPGQLRDQVVEISADSISHISVKLHDDRVVVWGGTENSQRKGAVTLPLLTQPGQTYDVSSPDLPTVR